MESQLTRMEKELIRHGKILDNGLKDRMERIEKVVETALTPQPPWQKFLFKTGGTFIIIALFTGSLYLLLRIMPADTLIQLVQAIIGVL